MGDELGSATSIDRLNVSSGLYTKYHLGRERRFLELPHRDFWYKNTSQNWYFFCSFLGYLGNDRVGFSNF